MEAETKATDDGRPLGRRMTSRVGAAAHAPIWSEQPLAARSRYEFSTSSKKPHPADSFTSVTLDRLRSSANGCAGNRI